MLIFCDYCLLIQKEIYKIPSSMFYIEGKTLVVLQDYVHLCPTCLLQNEKGNDKP
jgi:hypothetical protein